MHEAIAGKIGLGHVICQLGPNFALGKMEIQMYTFLYTPQNRSRLDHSHF